LNKQFNNALACHTTKTNTPIFSENWAAISPTKIKYTEMPDAVSVYQKYLNTLYRAAHCNAGNQASICNPQGSDSCNFRSQYVKYEYCYCDPIPGNLEPLNFTTNQIIDVEIIPAASGTSLNYKAKTYSCASSGCSPYLTSVKMDVGKLESGQVFNPITVNTVTNDTGISTTKLFNFETDPVVEKYGIHAAAWLEATNPALRQLPIIGTEEDLLNLDEFGVSFNSVGLQFAPSILGESASIDTGNIQIFIRPNITPPSNIADNGGDPGSFITDFSGTMWVVNETLTRAKVVSIGLSDYDPSGILFNINDADLTSTEWYSESGIYRLAFKMTVTAYLGTDGLGDPIYRTHTKLYSYGIAGASTKKAPSNKTPIKNKLLNGECVSLDCSQVQALCDSLTDC
jgi:hypothetical protein